MFNYTKEVIINNVEDKVVAGENGMIVVKRGGNYYVDNIVDKKIYKTEGTEGSLSTATITPTALGSADVLRLTIVLGTPGAELGEFAMPNWAEFGKPIVIETVAEDADGLIEAIKLAMPYDNKLFTVEELEGTVVLTAAETWMSFVEGECKLEKVTFASCADCSMQETVEDTKGVEVVAGVPEFATAKWIVENLRFPSYPNVRYKGLYSDEAPVAGTVYTQLAFQYCVKNATPGGLSGVGQVVDSITTHVFYVPKADAAKFTQKFSGATVVDHATEHAS